VIKNLLFGDIVMVKVGATMVGSMIQTYRGTSVKKAEEKGYFKFGGSTVILLFEKGKIKIDQDLLANISKGLESTIKMGERIAEQK
jgi:phosphatidylserine decarboxylase